MSTYGGPNSNFQSSNIWERLSCDGAIKAVPVVCDFALQDAFDFDLLYAQQQEFLPALGTIYFDNARITGANGPATASSVTVQFDGTDQRLVLAADTQGYLPVLSQRTPRFSVTGVSNSAPVQIIMLSVLLPGLIWTV